MLSENKKMQYQLVKMDMDDALSSMALHELSCYLNRYFKKNVIILLDEYDTPMQKAYYNDSQRGKSFQKNGDHYGV